MGVHKCNFGTNNTHFRFWDRPEGWEDTICSVSSRVGTIEIYDFSASNVGHDGFASGLLPRQQNEVLNLLCAGRYYKLQRLIKHSKGVWWGKDLQGKTKGNLKKQQPPSNETAPRGDWLVERFCTAVAFSLTEEFQVRNRDFAFLVPPLSDEPVWVHAREAVYRNQLVSHESKLAAICRLVVI